MVEYDEELDEFLECFFRAGGTAQMLIKYEAKGGDLRDLVHLDWETIRDWINEGVEPGIRQGPEDQ